MSYVMIFLFGGHANLQILLGNLIRNNQTTPRHQGIEEAFPWLRWREGSWGRLGTLATVDDDKIFNIYDVGSVANRNFRQVLVVVNPVTAI